MVSKPLVSPNEKPSEDDKAGDNDVEKYAWVKLVLDFGQPRLPRTGVSL